MEQATTVSYAFGYVAAMIGALLILLPVLIPVLLLLLVAGVVQLLVLGIRALGVAVYRYTAGLIRGLLANGQRSPTERIEGDHSSGNRHAKRIL